MARSASLENDAPALRVLFELFYEDAYRSAYMITRNQHQAEDVTQEAFLKAFNHFDTLAEPKKFGAWLKSIVVRTAIDLL
ncbi:MAG TPA: sigma-70 family RNA polymerase sigma factor, partial [Firmicutes bacterium]|nr:sigma-70 family RNA polymerase sigma factor [Bacillota bacterium]